MEMELWILWQNDMISDQNQIHLRMPQHRIRNSDAEKEWETLLLDTISFVSVSVMDQFLYYD